jgi:xylan 1,4-beta-xylosidase
VAIALWNGSLDQTKTTGDDRLSRHVTLDLTGLSPGEYRLEHHRVDHEHSNIARTWEALGAGDWPTTDQWARLRAADRLEALTPEESVSVGADGVAHVAFDLPMPAISFVELRPAT